MTISRDGEQYKVCTKCKETKKIDHFYKNKLRPDGFNYLCKPCEKAYRKEWKKNKKNVVWERLSKLKELDRKKVHKFLIPEELNEEVVASWPFRCPYCQSHCSDKNRVIMKYSGTSLDKMKDIWRGECIDCGREWYWEAT